MDNETIFEVDSRKYVNPQTGLNESQQFIETLRDVQAQNTAEINQNTYNLGSQVPSNVGGLTGSEGLWQAQYQTPQVDAQIANLKAVANEAALNQMKSNLNAIEQNRLRQAWRDYYRRQRDKANSGGGTTSDDDPTKDGDVEILGSIDTDKIQAGQAPVGWVYVANPVGGDRWYKRKEDGTIDYNSYVDKNPYTRTSTRLTGQNYETGEGIIEIKEYAPGGAVKETKNYIRGK